ncbi:phosphatase PAP2-related protein [Fibrella aquatica]|jgi:PAP2 superfamily C-terminal|uniref:phosphatase PAP2-related protein n=1 Tax=Fibrella aquatica TaxID=3242487 RepID=UPI003521DC9F
MNDSLKHALISDAKSVGWKQAWQQTRFRQMAIGGLLLICALLAVWPWYLARIEARNGMILNDVVLDVLPRFDMSIPVFMSLWGAALLLIYRVQKAPAIYLRFIWAYVFLFISRVISIGLTPLDPPPGLIELHDPLSNYFYGAKFITKDLFFSGHTASIFLMALCLVRPLDRWLVFLGTAIVAIGVLIQRVHYTADVVAAPAFTYAVYWLSGLFIRKMRV